MKKVTLILVIVLISVAYGQKGKQSFLGLGQKPVCVFNGDYCKDNSDCCSKKCTSNKCMISNATAISTNDVNLPQQQQQQQNLALDNRFNAASQENCQNKVGGGCSSSLKCCHFMSCENNICRDRSVIISGTETLGYDPNAVLVNRFNEDENSSAAPAKPTRCMDIGEKCYDPSECCTPFKCHSFLHQCVT